MGSMTKIFLGVLIISAVCMTPANLVTRAEAGMTLGQQIDIYVGPNDQQGSSSAYDSVNKRFLVVWGEPVPDPVAASHVYGQLVNQDGSLYGGRIGVYVDTTNHPGGGPKAAFDPVNQHFLVTWSQTFDEGFGWYGKGPEVVGQFINSNGSLSGNNFVISPLTPDEYVYEYNVDIVFDPALNRFAAVVSSWNAGPNNLHVRFVNSDGSLGDFLQITDFTSGYGTWHASMGYDSNNDRFLVAYGNGDDSNIYARLLNADGTYYSAEFAITSDGQAGRISSIAFDLFSNRFLVIFGWGSGIGRSIKGQLINADGSMYGDIFTFHSYYADYGSAVFDMVNKKFLVVYGYYEGAFAQLLNSDGTFSGPAFFITDRGFVSLFTTGGSSDFLAAWEINLGIGTGRDIYGKTIHVLDDYILYIPEMLWDTIEAPYNSTGAAAAQMILNYIREGAQASWLAEGTIYVYAKNPASLTDDLTPDEMAKVLGHFDPYDSLISNWSDSYDSLPEGNPYKGYNFTVDSYDPGSDPTSALNNYMRDICHWMAYTVTKEDWWLDGELVARPNTPAAIPIFGTYDHWVAVNGFSASANPTPQPHTNPEILPDFTVNAFWMKDPLVNGIGQNAYKTAAECALSYFLPLSTTDDYNGKFVQVAEPPPQMSGANVQIAVPGKDAANLEFIGVRSKASGSNTFALMNGSSAVTDLTVVNPKPFIKKRDWSDILPAQLLSDAECYAAFNGTKKGKSILVKRVDIKNADYYLALFNKRNKKGRYLTSGVIILDAKDGYFKEAGWTKEPEEFLRVDEKGAVKLIKKSILANLPGKLKKPFAVSMGEAELCWEPNSQYSLSPYQPYWRIEVNGCIWYVTQDSKVISERGLDATFG